jgi:hypothetical protein
MSPQPYAIMYHQGPSRNALIMFHTIQDTSLKQIHKRHTFTDENLNHTISDRVATMLFHQTLLQLNKPLFFRALPHISDLSTYKLQMYITCPSAAHVCMQSLLMNPMYNLIKLLFLVFYNSKNFSHANSFTASELISQTQP